MKLVLTISAAITAIALLLFSISYCQHVRSESHKHEMSFQVKLFIKAVDWIAILIAVLAITVLLPVLIFQGILGVLGAWGSMFWHSSDKILLILVIASVARCAFRWKELNKRP